MIHRIPPGTRDVLPEEMRELRRLKAALIEVFEARGYGEVATPAIEYDEVLARGDGRTARSAYRFFDESGELLALRSDMTVPIARLVASRFAAAEPPLRLCYLASAYRAVRPQRGQMREFMQAGVELIGAPAPAGTVEVIEVLEAALDAAGLERAVIGLGDADLYRQLLEELGVEGEARDAVLASLATHDLVGIEEKLSEAGIGAEQVRT
ncbi:MAG TPA: ATP phosphoribosyltransferase regulatory subunit, partial [Solirubrobacterales bacterium]